MTARSVTNAIVMIIAASSTSGSVKPDSPRRLCRPSEGTRVIGNMYKVVCNGGAPPQQIDRPSEVRAVTTYLRCRTGQFPTTPGDKTRRRRVDLSPSTDARQRVAAGRAVIPGGASVARSSRHDRQSQHLHEPDRADSDHEPAEIRVILPRDRIRLVQVSPEQLARRQREVHLVACR